MIRRGPFKRGSQAFSVLLAVGVAFASYSCKKAVTPPLTVPHPNLAPLGSAPDWRTLDAYQGSITRDVFEQWLTTHYCQPLAWLPHIQIGPKSALITMQSTNPAGARYELKFAEQLPAMPPVRYWRAPTEIPASPDPQKPLLGVRIGIDPGHIGGKYADMEERSFKPLQDHPAVEEGSITLLTAQKVKTALEQHGAEVFLVRSQETPVTKETPETLQAAAEAELRAEGLDPLKAENAKKLRSARQRLFYRTAEIRARAAYFNDVTRPDAILCLHFDAGAWGPSVGGKFTTANHLHMLLCGGWGQPELLMDDQRHELLVKLLQRTHEAEIPLSAAVGEALALATQLPPRHYSSGAVNVAGNPLLWARNLLATRLYRCPVAYCEPYCMNNKTVFHRIHAGDFPGEQEIPALPGKTYRSIYAEYAAAVVMGLLRYFER